MSQTSKIFGLLLNDDRQLYDQLRFAVQLTVDDFPVQEDKELWACIQDAVDSNHPILPGVIASRYKIDEGWLKDLWDAGFGTGAEEAISYARQLVEQTDRVRAQQALSKASQEVKNGKSIALVQQDLVSALTLPRGSVLQSAKTYDIGKRVQATIDAGNIPMITSTGISWFDYFLDGGFQQRSFIAIGGRQKGRKTSVARNLMLGAARDPKADVILLAYENDQIISYYDLVAMEAAREAYNLGLHLQDSSAGKPLTNRLGGAILMNAHQSRKLDTWDKRLKACVDHAMIVVEGLPISIYDTKPENGGLDNLSSLLMVMEMHRQLTPQGKHLIFFIDYAQLVNNVGKDYEDMKALSQKLLWASQHYDATVIVLTQFNEAANFMKAQDKKAKQRTDFLGTKGGGSLEAAVQNFFVTDYDPQSPNSLRVEQARSRRSGWGEQFFEIHPASGLLIHEPRTN